MKTVLFIHHSAEMYGSDKVLLDIVLCLDKEQFRPIVYLPEDGPLAAALKDSGIEVVFGVVCKLSRATFTIRGTLSFIMELFQAYKAISKLADDNKIDIVHSNTLAVFGGGVWSRLNSVPHIWHIHEIILKPRFVKKMLPFLVSLFADRVICNSRSTADWILTEQPNLKNKTSVIWNGLSCQCQLEGERGSLRKELGVAKGSILVGLVGRINKWKGQRLLLEAAEILHDRGIKNVVFVCIGGTYKGQEELKAQLLLNVRRSRAKDIFYVLDYRPNIIELWNDIDIGVVPSTEPEPFGVVALEAMSAGLPVIAAAHGGLTDIIVPDQTGMLFRPKDPQSLSDALVRLIEDRHQRKRMGRAGRERLKNVFSLETQVKKIQDVYRSVSVDD